MSDSSVTARSLQIKAEAKRDDKLKHIEQLKAQLESADPRRITQLNKAMAKALKELAELTDKVDATKIVDNYRTSKRKATTQLRLQILEQKRAILDLQIAAVKADLERQA